MPFTPDITVKFECAHRMTACTVTKKKKDTKKSFRIDYSCNGYKQTDLPHKRYDYIARLIHCLSHRTGIYIYPARVTVRQRPISIPASHCFVDRKLL